MAAIELDYGDKEAALDYINQTIELAQTIPNRQNEIPLSFQSGQHHSVDEALIEARKAAVKTPPMKVTKNIPQDLIGPEIKVLQLANAADLQLISKLTMRKQKN